MNNFDKIKQVLIVLLGVVVLFSCENTPKDVRLVLKAAGDNRAELEKVIDHYKSTGEREKLKVAYFLIGNMDDKYALDGDVIRKYDPLFDYFKSLREKRVPLSYNSSFFEAVWDSMVSVLGPVSAQDAEIVPDYKKIKADYLINNIDLAFAIRDSLPWGQKINFDQFCEFVVSYRFNHEPLENWRSYYHDKYHLMWDTLKADSCHQLAAKVYKSIPKTKGLTVFSRYPFDLLIDQMEAARIGTCVHTAAHEAMVMRSAGLPVAIDFVPAWGDFNTGHTWNVLIGENGRPFHSEGPPFIFRHYYVYKFAKAYRKTFGRQPTDFHGHEQEIPQIIRNDHLIDVTPEYTRTLTITIPIKYPSPTRKRYALICSPSKNTWTAQDWGEIIHKKVSFKNMGLDNLYIAMYLENGILSPASDPFILTKEGRIVNVTLSGDMQDMLLYRKYTLFKSIRTYHESMVGGSFQGANRPDFKDSVDLFTVTSMPEKIETVHVSNASKYRYVRFSSPFPGKGDVAELEFYGGNSEGDSMKLEGKPIGFPEVAPSIATPYQNAFDGNIDTYFSQPNGRLHHWAGLDLGKPARINKIRYCPRSDTNFIVPGDRYELCYWKQGEWISMGEQTAKDAFLKYDNVPSGGLYLLHNLSRGKEERVFTYEEGKQVFW